MCRGAYLLFRSYIVGVVRQMFGLCEYTRARCYSSLKSIVTIEILHIKEIGEGELQKALV